MEVEVGTEAETNLNDIVAKLDNHFQQNDYNAAYEEILEPANKESIVLMAMELISKICEVGLQDTYLQLSSPQNQLCIEMLRHICCIANPKLTMISLLEQAESFADNSKFTIILSIIQYTIAKLPRKKASIYSSTIYLCNKHLKNFHIFPKEFQHQLIEMNQTENFLMLENHPRVQEILIYVAILYNFFHACVTDLSHQPCPEHNDVTEIAAQRRALTLGLTGMLGHPLIYFPLGQAHDPVPIHSEELGNPRQKINKEEIVHLPPQKTQAEDLTEKIMKTICNLNYDSSFFARYLGRNFNNEEVGEFGADQTAIVNFFYLALVKNFGPDQVATVYAPKYILKILLLPITHVIMSETQHYQAIQKALLLAEKLINQILETDLLTSEFVNRPPFSLFFGILTRTVLHCESLPIRQLSLNVLKSYFWKFDPPGMYTFMMLSFAKITHSGLRGFMIGQLKDCVAKAWDTGSESLSSYFLGDKLMHLIRPICILKKGPKTFPLELYDEIVSSLNLLRFLLIREMGPMTPMSGILTEMPLIDKSMLTPLRTSLDLSTVYYNMQLIQLTEGGSRIRTDENEIETECFVDGLQLDCPVTSVQDKIKATKAGLLNLDIMSSLLARVMECYSNVLKL